MTKQPTQVTVIPIQCPDCGKFHKPSFVRSGFEDVASNTTCKCHKKKHGLGFDIKYNSVPISGADSSGQISFVEITSSGIQNEWKKSHIWCPVCGTSQNSIADGDVTKNQSCINDECPVIGYDYKIKDDMAYIVASGMQIPVNKFLYTKYKNSPASKAMPINRSNY